MPRVTEKQYNLELLKYMMESNQEAVPVTLTFGDLGEFEFQYRPLGWMGKSRCVTGATEYAPEYDKAGNVTGVKSIFHLDVYKAAAVKEMFNIDELDNPVPFTDQTLNSLSEELGSQLDPLIPDPFSSAPKAGAVKKERAPSAETAG